MKINELLEEYRQSADYLKYKHGLIHAIQKRNSVHVRGFAGSSRSFLAASTILEWHQTPKIISEGSCFLFISANREDAEYFAQDLESLMDHKKKVHVFPSSLKKKYQYDSWVPEDIQARTEVLTLIQKKGESENHSSAITLISTFPEALIEKTIQPGDLVKNSFLVHKGDTLDIDFFLEFLFEHHFERVDFVYTPGCFSWRGGILDVFSFSHEKPFRIELDGSLIESIREFDPEDQLSTREMGFFQLVPDVQLHATQYTSGCFFDYLPENTCIWSQDLPDILEKTQLIHQKALGHSMTYQVGEELTLPFMAADYFMNAPDFKNKLSSFVHVEWGNRFYYSDPSSIITFQHSHIPEFQQHFPLIIQDFKSRMDSDMKLFVFSESGKQIERLYSIFEDIEAGIVFEPVFHGLREGFVDEKEKKVYYTEHQLFNRHYALKKRRQNNQTRFLTLKEIRELAPGDYVVHNDHGIGKFGGLVKTENHGIRVEVVRIVYKDNDLLYVPIQSLHKISKFQGKEGSPPRLNKLGSDAWEKLKRQTKNKVKDIARDLIKLYATRKANPGFSFSPDSYLQTELEASFVYEDTPDQARATEDVKKDMESPHPMDRLVCGDVGFGKTEIAIRAAFKAVCDSKQVAILVPTTILAHQHYRTFKDRFKNFPVNVDYVNRFRSALEQKDILRRTASGQIDILIGTHRILSKDIRFKNLGLLIIDEEQKFGVTAKEKLKEFRANIDTLTLTATPIPRTLHFSLMGARDLSIINTPPPNRQPVTTELHAFGLDLIRDALRFEKERGGQSFLIHDKVKDIYDLAEKVRESCPELKIGVGHGQLEGHELEEVMIRFMEGEYDVLIATTIIESGLDISNANTIIINNAHMYGLSDLHQMRGRVGRSNKKAYCYLLIPGFSGMSEDSRKRLAAIEEFSDLGSGFNVAMRDLDIRGSGNLLGAEQSGFIAEIGFDMYHKILDEAVRELKDEEFGDIFGDEIQEKTQKDVTIESDLPLMIPDVYVRSTQERLALYSELAGIKNEDHLQKFLYKLKDRFGPLPPQVIDLTDAIRIKWHCQELGFEKASYKNQSLTCYFPSDQQDGYYESSKFQSIMDAIGANSTQYQVKQTNKALTLTIKPIAGIIAASDALLELKKQT